MGGLRFLQGRYKEAEPVISMCVSNLKGMHEHKCRRTLAYATVIQGMLELFLSADSNAAKKTQEQSCALMKDIGDPWGLALATSDLGRAVMRADKYPKARTYFRRALSMWEQLKDEWGVALTWTAWGEAAMDKDPDLARKLLEQALDLYPRMGDRWGEALTLLLLGKLNAAKDDLETAERLLRKSLTIHRIIGRGQLIGECLQALGDCLAQRCAFLRAAFLYGAGHTLKSEVRDPKQVAAYQSRVNRLRRQAISSGLAKADLNRSFCEGQLADREEAIALALESES